jgi:DNA-binding SARP family transcriptional activator
MTKDPWLLFWRAHASMPRDLFAAREDFRQAYLLFKALGDAAGSYLAWSGAVDTYMYLWHDFVPLDYWIAEMAELRRRFPAYPSLDVEAQATCGMIGAATYRPVDQPVMREWLAAGIALMDRPIHPAVKVRIGSLVLFFLLYREHRIVECRLLSAKIRAVAEDPEIGILAKLMWQMTHAAVLATDGSADEAIAVAGEGLKLAAESGVHHVDFFLHTQLVYAHLAAFDVESAAQHVKSVEALISKSQAFDSALYHYMATWVLLGQNQPRLALEHICTSTEATMRAGCSSHAAYDAVAHAQVLYECGRTEEAMAMIERAREWGMRMEAPFIEIHYQCLKALEALDRHDQNDCRAALAAAIGAWKEREYATVPWIGWRKPHLTRVLHQALVLDIEPDFVCSRIRDLRLTPPAHEPLSEKWPFPVRLRALGGFSVEMDNQAMARPQVHRRPLELLQALVALGGRGVDDHRLADALWPEAEGDAARQNLKMNVHRLRALLPEGALLWSEGKLSLDEQRIWVDVWALERELESLEQSMPKTWSEAQPLINRVLGLYHGDFLPDSATSWAPAMRERLRNRTLRLTARAAEAIGKSEPAAAVPIYERAIELDPLREPLYQGLMRCYLELRQPAEGLRIHRRCHDVLRRELGVAPTPETESLRQALKEAQ